MNRVLLNARFQSEQALLYSFDTVKEASIRNNLRNLLGRTKEQIKEEEVFDLFF